MLLAAAACVVAGCLPGSGAAEGVGSLVVAASIRTVPSASEPLEKVLLMLTNGGYSVVEEVPIEGKSATATLSGLAVGTWQIEATALDIAGDAVYAGTAKANVKRDASTPVALTLKPLDGSLRLEISILGVPGEEDAAFVDVLVYYAGSTSPYRSYRDLPVEAGFVAVDDTGLVPRSYDMRVVVTATEGTVLYESEYVSFGIRPGKLTTVEWTPAFGSLEVHLDIAAMPLPPQNVAVSIEGTKATVSWDPGEEWVASYRVYWRYSEFDRYSSSRCNTVEAPETSVVVGLSAAQKGSTVRFVVVARDASGQESLRSEEVACAY